MKPIVLICLFIAGSMANSYGSVKVSYGTQVQSAAPISYAPPPAPAAPPVMRTYQSYSPPPPPPPPPPAAPPAISYTPAPPPAISYSAPPPAAPPVSYSYSSPPPAAPPMTSYSAPAPAAPVAYGSYGSSSSGPSVVREHIPIVRYNEEIREGMHSHEYHTGHGITHQESTQIRLHPGSVGTPDDIHHGSAYVTKTGSYTYKTPEGHTIELKYVADKDGFRPEGAHLPTPPPIPAEIQESLKFNALHPHSEHEEVPTSAMSSSSSSSYGGYSSPPPASPPAVSYGYSAPPPPPPPPPPASPPMFSYSAYETPVVRTSYQPPAVKTSYTAPPPPPPAPVRSAY